MSNEKKESLFIVIPSEAITELNLSGNELIVFSFIHGFSKGERGVYDGGLAYLSRRVNVNRRNVINILERLEKAGHITKKEIYKGGVKFCEYKSVYINGWCRNVTSDETSLVSNHHQGSDERSLVGSDETSPNNKYNNKDKVREESRHTKELSVLTEKKGKTKRESSAKERKRTPSLAEVREFIEDEAIQVDARVFFNYYEARGWRNIVDWKAELRLWESRNDKPKEKPTRRIDPEYEAFKNRERI